MRLPQGWKEFELGEVLDYEQPGDYIVDSDEYSDEYETPVLTAGKSFILGYTDEKEGIYTKLPVIIFDDFTTANHFVTFPFKVKSSAMKLLTPKIKDINLKFIFCMMKGIHHNTITHKRYYISAFQQKKIPIPVKEDGTPDLKRQEKIIEFIEKVEKTKDWRKEADDLTITLLKSIFFDMFLREKGKFEILKLEKVSTKITDGKHGDCENLDNSKFYFISAKDIYDGEVHYEDARQIVPEGYTEVNKRVNLELGDVLITNSGTIGKIAIMDNTEKVDRTTFQKSVAIIKNKNEIITSIFLKYFLETTKEKLMNTSSGSSQKNLLLKDIRDIDIPIPPIKLQEKFASIVKEFESIKEQQKHSKNQIDSLFNASMQKAFKGELKV